jgi:ArsR family transcriptional regulator
METVLRTLRAAAEPTRLRLLALCAGGELTVSELVHILGQSQPRISRHLRLLCDAGLLQRQREGAWMFHRLARDGVGGALAAALLPLLPDDDETLARDRARLAEVKAERARAAAAYFRANAARWDRIRSLHVDERQVEAALLRMLPPDGICDLLDLGTGTGRMLELYGPRVERAIGVDLSREMLAVARANLEKAGLGDCSVRQADLFGLPFADAEFDAVVVHQVLHYLDEPDRALREAARVLRPGGRIAVVDFAPHEHEELRAEHSHLRLGIAADEFARWCADAGLDITDSARLAGDPLTVTLWLAAKPAARKRATAKTSRSTSP